jgi:hypothetical protein
MDDTLHSSIGKHLRAHQQPLESLTACLMLRQMKFVNLELVERPALHM